MFRLGLLRSWSSAAKLTLSPKNRPVIRTYATPLIKYQPPNQKVNVYSRFQHNQKVPFFKSKRVWVFMGTGTVIFGGYYVTHLERVPITGRARFMDITPRQEEAMAIQAYNEVMHQYGRKILPKNHPYSKFVSRIAQRLVNVSGMEDMKWEFYVVDSPEKNAFVLPGGKVFVFTGILPIVQNEDGMAAVLGHEISHQIARHSAEKLSFAKILFVLQITLSLFGIDPSFVFNAFTTNFLMMMPFSRKCETEADDIGLQLMAQACFDPREAINVWKRMEASGEAGIPQFASTHPSNKNRIQFLTKELPSALQKRAESDCSSDMHRFSEQFRAKNWARC
ncbi:hypothetical protein MFLAVUS_008934 [Mucor flavus]|uniref:Peptidase M48 domain-containing protein n=1 Tax=Mucor flavus TaxID=439312 RepID=A0ABP9Z8G8_9FUNG